MHVLFCFSMIMFLKNLTLSNSHCSIYYFIFRVDMENLEWCLWSQRSFNSNLFLWLSVQFATTATNYKLIDRNSKEKNKRPDMMRKSWTARKSKPKCRPPTPEKPGAENCNAFLRPPQLFLGLRVLIVHRPLFLPTTASFSRSNWYIVSDLQQENTQSWRKCP